MQVHIRALSNVTRKDGGVGQSVSLVDCIASNLQPHSTFSLFHPSSTTIDTPPPPLQFIRCTTEARSQSSFTCVKSIPPQNVALLVYHNQRQTALYVRHVPTCLPTLAPPPPPLTRGVSTRTVFFMSRPGPWPWLFVEHASLWRRPSVGVEQNIALDLQRLWLAM